jgi:hypothetical protein
MIHLDALATVIPGMDGKAHAGAANPIQIELLIMVAALAGPLILLGAISQIAGGVQALPTVLIEEVEESDAAYRICDYVPLLVVRAQYVVVLVHFPTVGR